MGQENRITWKDFLLLHIVFFIVSLGGAASKQAATYEFFSIPFFIFYGFYIMTLGVYAVSWVQIIKRVPLVTAFCNKAITVVWTLILGAVLFKETISIKSMIAAIIVIIGVILVVTSDE